MKTPEASDNKHHVGTAACRNPLTISLRSTGRGAQAEPAEEQGEPPQP